MVRTEEKRRYLKLSYSWDFRSKDLGMNTKEGVSYEDSGKHFGMAKKTIDGVSI
ncbi:hypothetical protein [Holospora curviuscula]|uniref:Uncharacterized protein n=1 Tax=Holospora curviuscula TaxID=1082868 RepID=A0A2S5R8E5_9PROT|nr:hypothetical protein [Holospora curviuscula]PPE03588.1 hypothetical protein HCUR_00953 [Holospora curviuscula]